MSIKAQATGNIVADAELRYTNNGKAVANFRLACTRRTQDTTGNWVDANTTFLQCSTFNNAENVAKHLHKGARVVVNGEIENREWQKDGKNGMTLSMLCKEIGIIPLSAKTPTQPQPPQQTPQPARQEPVDMWGNPENSFAF